MTGTTTEETTTMTTTQITTATGRQVRIKIERVGRNFAWVGFVRAANNRTIAETKLYPTRETAYSAAIELANKVGR